MFDTQRVFLKEFFEIVDFEKISRQQNSMTNFSGCKELKTQNHSVSRYIHFYKQIEPVHDGMCDQQNLRSACAYTQSGQSLCSSLEFSTSVKLLTEHHWSY